MHILSNDEQQAISSTNLSSFIFARASSPHAQHPERNEDYILIDRHYGLVAVLDEVGGREAGEVASHTEHSYFAKRNGITQSLGQHKPLDIHLGQSTLNPGDRILLCTDGIHDNLTDQEIADTLAQSGKTTVAKRLVQQAIERSHQHDDTTIRAKADDMSALVITVARQ